MCACYILDTVLCSLTFYYVIAVFGMLGLSHVKGQSVDCPPDGVSCDLRKDT